MNTKALFVVVATGLAVGAGAAKAQQLDELETLIDLPSIADLILSELLEDEDDPFGLAIGFSFGLSFTSDAITFADTFSEGLVLGDSSGNLVGVVDTFGETLVAPGLAGTTTGLNTVIVYLPPDLAHTDDPVSWD